MQAATPSDGRLEFLQQHPSGELSRMTALMGPDKDLWYYYDRTLFLSFSSSDLGPTGSLDDYARLTMKFAKGHRYEGGGGRYDVRYNQGISEQPYQIVTAGNDAIAKGEKLLTQISGKEITPDLPNHPLLDRFLSFDQRF